MQTRPASVNYARHTDQEEPVILIVGVGQTGLSLGARLKQLNISTILIEQVFPLTYMSTILTRATARTTGSVTTGENGTSLLFCMVSALYRCQKNDLIYCHRRSRLVRSPSLCPFPRPLAQIVSLVILWRDDGWLTDI